MTDGQQQTDSEPLDQPQPVATSITHVGRPARALLGWLDQEQGVRLQLGQRADAVASPEQSERVRAARAAVAARERGIDQAGAIQELPDQLGTHIDTLGNHPGMQPYFGEGWTPALVDLSRICALQPTIFTDDAEQRVQDVDPEDLLGIASISLPVPPAEAQIPAQFDEVNKAWVISAANPNLRLVGQWGGPVQPGTIGYGFLVAMLPSVVQVGRYEGRCILRDGYHRTYGFLSRGITHVPAFVHDFSALAELNPGAGMLPQETYLGNQPPRLVDYLDDTVSATVQLPATQKMLVVSGLELTPIG